VRILQIAPEIAPGSGVGGVAHHLESAWARAGVTTDRFTMTEARGDWLPQPGPGVRGKLALIARVVWFSTVGTVLARRAIARAGRAPGSPATVAICHNDVLAGDVYVNHGILRVAMQARGRSTWRMVRNPLHLFTSARDAVRYRGRTHRVVVNLTGAERDALRRTYPHLVPRAVVIGNGVDTSRFQPPSDEVRREARSRLGVPEDALHVVFVGHEFDRKGLPLVLEAVARAGRGAAGAVPAAGSHPLDQAHVSVVGGTEDMLVAVRRDVGRLGLAGRVHLAGQVPDPLPWLHAADVLVLPSAYEANALVVLEALACGVPVVATPVGYAPEVIDDGVNGHLVERTAAGVRRGLESLAERTPEETVAMSRAARSSAEQHDWDRVAATYLRLAESLTRTGARRFVTTEAR
jgi:glycosyltransferase involved in cell wall biosynthesis